MTSATGRVFLAFLPRRQTAALAAHEAMAGGGDPAALAAHALAMGMGHVTGDHIPGLSAVAAPVLDAFGEAAAVITLVGMRDGVMPGTAERLRDAAAAASLRLGWQPRDARAAIQFCDVIERILPMANVFSLPERPAAAIAGTSDTFPVGRLHRPQLRGARARDGQGPQSRRALLFQQMGRCAGRERFDRALSA